MPRGGRRWTFLLDAQLPPVLAQWIRNTGQADAVHVSDALWAGARDKEILEYADANDMVLMTKDSDFLRLRGFSNPSPRIVWIRFGNASNPALIAAIHPRFEQALRWLDQGNHLVEID